MLAHPIGSWDEVSLEFQGNSQHFWWALLVVSVTPGIFYAVASSSALDALIILIAMPIPASLAMCVLILIEQSGARFFGTKREWRITHEVAATVVWISSIAWILSAIGVGLVGGLFSRGIIPKQNVIGPVSVYAIALFLGFLPGLLWFETLVWIGMQKLRFANIPGSERHLAPSPEDG